jgi:hypothetical protein
MTPILNISYRKVGGLRFLKIGRLTLSWALAERYRPFKARNVNEAYDNLCFYIEETKQLDRRQG